MQIFVLGQITTYPLVVWLKFKLLTCDLKFDTLLTWDTTQKKKDLLQWAKSTVEAPKSVAKGAFWPLAAGAIAAVLPATVAVPL